MYVVGTSSSPCFGCSHHHCQPSCRSGCPLGQGRPDFTSASENVKCFCGWDEAIGIRAGDAVKDSPSHESQRIG